MTLDCVRPTQFRPITNAPSLAYLLSTLRWPMSSYAVTQLVEMWRRVDQSPPVLSQACRQSHMLFNWTHKTNTLFGLLERHYFYAKYTSL